MRTLEQVKELAARRVKDHVAGNMPILQSQAFMRFAQGLRESDFEEVVIDLLTQKVIARDMTQRGAFILRKYVG